MSTLLRAPRECGSWIWELEDRELPGLGPALATAGRMTEVLSKMDLLVPARLEYGWYVHGKGGIGITNTLALKGMLGDSALVDRIHESRPAGFPTAEIFDIRVLGSGTWLDGDGKEHKEANLVDVTVTPSPWGHAVELSVHHDIWSFYDFSGHPHPEVQRRNAPRLAAAVEQLDAVLGVAATPGEPTYFGTAEGYGIKTPSPFEDGLGPDLTDKL